MLIQGLVLGGLVMSCAAGDERPERAEKWISLFNGKDLNGWHVKLAGHDLDDNYGETFSVRNGVIRVSYDRYEKFGNKFGHMFYKDKFSNYRFRLEYRFVGEQAPGGPGWAYRNSGIMVHCQDPHTMRRDQSFPVCIEVQLLGGDGDNDRSTGNLCTPGSHVVLDGKLDTRHCINSSSPTYHGDQWVKAEVEVRGNKVIRHFINSEAVMEYEQPQLDENDADARKMIKDGDTMMRDGWISIQAESHPVEYRNIEILVLDE